MAEIISTFVCIVSVLNAYYKSGEHGEMLVVRLGLLLSDKSTQYTCDTMCIDHENPIVRSMSRKKAYQLALACGLSKRPDEASVLINKKCQVEYFIDDKGEYKIKRYNNLDDKTTQNNVVSDDILF